MHRAPPSADARQHRTPALNAEEPPSTLTRLHAGDLEARIEAFVSHYNYNRFHESLNNLKPADVYYGPGDAILEERRRLKRVTIAGPPAVGRLNLKSHA